MFTMIDSLFTVLCSLLSDLPIINLQSKMNQVVPPLPAQTIFVRVSENNPLDYIFRCQSSITNPFVSPACPDVLCQGPACTVPAGTRDVIFRVPFGRAKILYY
jgi:hypothetical protein